MKKKALVVISFGTTYQNAIKGIETIENTLKNAMEGYDFYRAFTSRMVISKIEKEQKIKIKTPIEVLTELYEQGYEEVLCQSLHIINGVEYFKTLSEIKSFEGKFKVLNFGNPLLHQVEDYKKSAALILNHIPKLKQDEALVLMGHGSEHFANSAYSQLELMMKSLGQEQVYVGTVEGFPDLAYILDRLRLGKIKKVYAMPFMIVAGDHAQNDLAGGQSDSWKCVMEKNGYEVAVILKGLGEIHGFGELFLTHLKEAPSI